MAHLNYYLDLCVEAYIVHNSAVLLRLHDKYEIWAGPGGHIDPGEDANEAVLREAWEEVGIRAALIGPEGWKKSDTSTNIDLVPPIFLNKHKINDVHSHTTFIFTAIADTRDINPQSKEDKDNGASCVWVTAEELTALREHDPRLRPETYRYAMTALQLASKA
jgi:8-oxo-dGTP pyrophosphatase MutT (NUDIX family)